jgi:hypothetical protein
MLALPKKWKNYELFKHEELKGSLRYNGLFLQSAHIQINNGEAYNITSKFTWFDPRFEITQNEEVLGQMRMNWKSEVSITLPDASAQKVASKGIFSKTYFIENQNMGERIEIKRKLNWRKLRYAYEIADSNAANHELTCLLAVHVIKSIDQRMAGFIAVSIVLLNQLIFRL